jgi:hypothetical protein
MSPDVALGSITLRHSNETSSTTSPWKMKPQTKVQVKETGNSEISRNLFSVFKIFT